MNRVLAMWRALDDRFASVESHPWGAVVTDPRYPLIWDVNYARVETEDPALRLEEIDRVLEPALEGVGAAHRHLVLFDPEALSEVLVGASSRGAKLTWDAVMVLDGDASAPGRGAAEIRVQEAAPDGALLGVVRRTLGEFEVRDDGVADQLIRIEREVMLPAGKRWFRVGDAGGEMALGSLLPVAGVGLVDHIVTLPFARRRGYAEAIVRRIVAEARSDGLDALVLLADPNGGALRLYERIGFRTVATIASTVELR